jgi:prepilin-type processing-associated H-X9-DG protein
MISDRTAIRWICYLGMDYLRYSNILYIDGHEHRDVVEYFEAFLKRMLEYANYFFQYEGDDMNIEMAPVLESSQRPLAEDIRRGLLD